MSTARGPGRGAWVPDWLRGQSRRFLVVPAGTGMRALRHAYASLLIAGGESVKVVSERLGHTNAAMTLNTYSHLFPDTEDRTRQAVDKAFRDHADPVRTKKAR